MDLLSPQAISRLRDSARLTQSAPMRTPLHRNPVGPRNNVTISDGNTYGNSSSGYRTRSTASMTNLRDAQPTERRDSVKNSRFLRAKLGFFRALYENTSRYALGRGLMPSSTCADREYAMRADELFLEWATRKTFSVREDMTFFESQKVILPDVLTDGDAGAAPVRDYNGNPRVQLFPSDVIADYGGASIFDRDGRGRWREGILRNAVGAPIAYRVLRDTVDRMITPGARAYWDYPANGFWHIGRNGRINENRPLPWLFHGDQSGLNILDINVLEMQVQKINSYFTGAVKTMNGELPMGIQAALASEEQTIANGTDADGNPLTKQVERTFMDLHGAGGILTMLPGEEFQFFTNGRNAANFKELIEYFASDIAIGFGLPIQFVWALTGLAGPQARMVLQQADGFFTDVADMLVTNYCQPVREAFLADAMNRGILKPPAAGTNWRSTHWQGPGSLTIDKGRDGKLHVTLVDNLMSTRKEFYRSTGKDGMTGLREAIEEIAQIREIAEEFGLPIELVLASLKGKAPGVAEGDAMATAVEEAVAAALAG
jgi:capsid protein